MTDRHAAYIVVLDQDIRDDDADEILTALRMVRHVASVEPVVASLDTHIAEARARTDLGDRVVRAVVAALDERS